MVEKKEPRRLRRQSKKKRTRGVSAGEPREHVFKRENGQHTQMQQTALIEGLVRRSPRRYKIFP